MKYANYIELGFERTNMNCGVEFSETGYHGFALEKDINENMLVSVTSGDLDKPKLYIRKRNSDSYHIMLIPTGTVVDLFSRMNDDKEKKKKKNNNKMKPETNLELSIKALSVYGGEPNIINSMLTNLKR